MVVVSKYVCLFSPLLGEDLFKMIFYFLLWQITIVTPFGDGYVS